VRLTGGVKSLFLDEHQSFVRYFVIPGDGPVHVYLAPLLSPTEATLLQVATHRRLAGRAAILVDYLGCGLSDRPLGFSHTMRDHARTVSAVLDHEGVRGAVVVGHSMGGTVGLFVALDRPELVGRLVLGESNLLPGGGDGTRRIASVPVDEYVGEVAPAELVALRARAVAGDAFAATMLAIRDHGSDPRAVHAASVDLVSLDRSLLRRFLDVDVPRSFLYGQRTLDALDGQWTPDVPDRELLEHWGVRTFAVTDAGHFMYADNLDGYVDAVVDATAAPT
jgi:pimeloyl-ACP methyl ester carboxylesterase